jgi:diguanylate cyclase (GGDEF)-like protein
VPRLVLRFATIVSLALAATAGVIFLVVRHYEIAQAEHLAGKSAVYATRSVLSRELSPHDLTHLVTGARRRQLDALFGSQEIPPGGVVQVSLIGHDGRITYSTDHRLIGHLADRSLVREAESDHDAVSDTDTSGGSGHTKVFSTYVPIKLGGPRSLGAIVFETRYGTITSAANAVLLPVVGSLEVALVALLVILGPLLARVARRIQHQIEEIHFRATHDDLTGLANRPQFADEIAAHFAADRNAALAVMLVDLDRFKEINDTLGHGAGDELLQRASERLRRTLTDTDIVARLGGDEFGIVLQGDATVAKAVAKRVCGALAAPFEIQGLLVSVEGSVGVALAPQHGTDANALLQHADVAMYLAKGRRTQVELYDPMEDPSDEDRLKVLSELRQALSAGELMPYFQPKVDMRTGLLSGAETLIRWRHPSRGILGPGEFLPSAEYTGLGKDINRFILEEAVRSCAEWNASGLDLDVSVNLTMIDLLDLNLPETVGEVLSRYRLAARRLTLEITETMIMADRERVTRVLGALEAMGVRLSIDDFGTGYTSLSYLLQLPVHEVKVDQSFVRGALASPEDGQVVRWTVGLGHSLGLKVVAEGVELLEQWESLEELGCDIAQGFLISKPIPNDEFVTFALARRPAPLPRAPLEANAFA